MEYLSPTPCIFYKKIYETLPGLAFYADKVQALILHKFCKVSPHYRSNSFLVQSIVILFKKCNRTNNC